MIWEPVIKLLRVEENFDFGTFGVWLISTRAFCVCLEPPDIENSRNISSIPAQQYECERYSSDKYPDTFQVMNVPNRDKVLIHAGNLKKHTEGCIMLAQHFGKLEVATQEERAVLNSGNTFKSFMNLMEGVKKFNLTIVEHYG